MWTMNILRRTQLSPRGEPGGRRDAFVLTARGAMQYMLPRRTDEPVSLAL